MKYYLDENTTPLAFHAFLKWVSLPLGILMTIGDLSTLSRSYLPSGWITIESVVSWIDLVLMVVALVGLIRMGGFGWMALMAHLALGAGYSLAVMGLVAQYDAPDAMSMAVSNLFMSLVYGGLVGLYYMKRRYLFFPEKVPPELRQTREESPAREPAPPAPSTIFCDHCGARLLPDSLFCSRCGARVKGEDPE